MLHKVQKNQKYAYCIALANTFAIITSSLTSILWRIYPTSNSFLLTYTLVTKSIITFFNLFQAFLIVYFAKMAIRFYRMMYKDIGKKGLFVWCVVFITIETVLIVLFSAFFNMSIIYWNITHKDWNVMDQVGS